MSVFIIPLAGLSSRFFKAGYTSPKYMLSIKNNESMFEWSVSSFKKYFSSDLFIFVCKDNYGTPEFIKNKILNLQIKNWEIVTLQEDTLGQADSVYEGIMRSLQVSSILDSDIYIFNIDSKLLDFKKDQDCACYDGYLEVFNEAGEQWSFVVPGKDQNVKKTAEKQRLSDLCSNGLYYFKNCHDFIKTHEYLKQNHIFSNNEMYIAPMYNYMISKNKVIKYIKVPREKVIICGTPVDYVKLEN